MVRGLESFKAWFRAWEANYVIIGGAACDTLMSEVGANFRATRDIDMVLIVEALNADFGARFWEYVKSCGYEHCRKSTDTPQFYRFTNPASPDCPYMIELFSRRMDGVLLPDEAVLTPLPTPDDISSLSAILLNDGYYNFLKSGVRVIDGLPILDVETHHSVQGEPDRLSPAFLMPKNLSFCPKAPKRLVIKRDVSGLFCVPTGQIESVWTGRTSPNISPGKPF
jgi:hypothetical protein